MTNDELNDILDGLDDGRAPAPGTPGAGRLAMQAPGLAARAAEPDEHTLHAAGSAAADTPAPDTPDAITTFLNTYGHGSSAEEDALIERLIFNPQPDYAAYLEEQEAAAPAPAGDAPAGDAQLDAINRFLAGPPPSIDLPDEEGCCSQRPDTARKPLAEGAAAPPDPRASLSESMARLLITQGQYAKAREALLQLDLENSEKKRYFALQIGFLDRLIANQQRLEAAARHEQKQQNA